MYAATAGGTSVWIERPAAIRSRTSVEETSCIVIGRTVNPRLRGREGRNQAGRYFPRVARPPRNVYPAERQESVGVAPVREVEQHVGAGNEEEGRGGANLGTYRCDRIGCVGGSRPVQVYTGDGKPGTVLQGQIEHSQPMAITSRSVGFQGRALRRNKPDLVQVARSSHLGGEREMTIVYRIKGPAK